MVWSSVASTCRIALNFGLLGTAVFWQRLFSLYSSWNKYQMLSAHQKQCSKILLFLTQEDGSACGIVVVVSTPSEDNVWHTSSSLCSCRFSRFAWNWEFSPLFVQAERGRSLGLLWELPLAQALWDRRFLFSALLHGKLPGSWDQLSPSSACALSHVLGVRDPVQKQQLLLHKLACPKFTQKF